MKDNEGYVSCEDGTRLYYRLAGAGADPVVIPNARMLAADLIPLAQDHQLIFYDQRGRGGSDTIMNESLIWSDYEVADIERIRQHFGFEKITLIG